MTSTDKECSTWSPLVRPKTINTLSSATILWKGVNMLILSAEPSSPSFLSALMTLLEWDSSRYFTKEVAQAYFCAWLELTWVQTKFSWGHSLQLVFRSTSTYVWTTLLRASAWDARTNTIWRAGFATRTFRDACRMWRTFVWNAVDFRYWLRTGACRTAMFWGTPDRWNFIITMEQV